MMLTPTTFPFKDLPMPKPYIVQTNKIGRAGDKWKGQVGYRISHLHTAVRQGRDLDCWCADQWPLHMLIPVAQVYQAIKHREKLFDAKYGQYELAYFAWQPNFSGKTPLAVAKVPQQTQLPL